MTLLLIPPGSHTRTSRLPPLFGGGWARCRIEMGVKSHVEDRLEQDVYVVKNYFACGGQPGNRTPISAFGGPRVHPLHQPSTMVSATGFKPAFNRLGNGAVIQLRYADKMVGDEGLEPSISRS